MHDERSCQAQVRLKITERACILAGFFSLLTILMMVVRLVYFEAVLNWQFIFEVDNVENNFTWTGFVIRECFDGFFSGQ
jgi:hypothetical protein